MRNLLTPLIGSYILLLNTAYAQQNMAFPAEVLNRPLNEIQFKATHNSYWLDHSPDRQIDQYNVWEIELDFGALSPSELVVGHDGPEPKFNLWYLRDWVNNVKAANSLKYHPIILKLEAKTRDSCGDFTCIGCCWGWPDVKDWGNWQQTLTDELIATIGLQNWFTSDEYEKTGWLSVQQLKGKFIISLQDNNEGPDANKDIQDKDSPYFFIGGVPLGAFGPINNPSEMGRALKSDASRLTFDDGYKEPWSNVLVHSPLPSWVDPLLRPQAKGQWGTILDPFQTVGHAINASWTRKGGPTSQVINLFTGNYADKVTISTPVELRNKNGTVTIGGKNVAYTITLSLMDEHEAGTDSPNSPVYVRLHGDKGVNRRPWACKSKSLS